jgi:hypothetical protein
MDCSSMTTSEIQAVELTRYYPTLAEWLERRAKVAELEQAYRTARFELQNFDAGHIAGMHRQRAALIQAGVKRGRGHRISLGWEIGTTVSTRDFRRRDCSAIHLTTPSGKRRTWVRSGRRDIGV